jgi:ribosome maturation factor RimP
MAGGVSVDRAVEAAVTALHYEVVEIERAARGLLRVTIDRVPGRMYPTGEGDALTVDDCEAVTRHLQYSLEVDGIDYERLEVSSPGLDRPLRTAVDFERHVGSEITLTLKAPLAGRKHFRGRLQAGSEGSGDWGVVFHDGKAEQLLGFALDEVREARLVPVLDFKGSESGRKAKRQARQQVRQGHPAQDQESQGQPAPGAADKDGGKDR